MLTILNIFFFCLSLFLLYLAKTARKSQMNRREQPEDSNELKYKILTIYQRIAAKTHRIRNLNGSAVIKIEGATEHSIQQLSSLIERLNITRSNTLRVLDLMKEKISLDIVKETLGKKYNNESSKATQEKYELILKEAIGQLMLIVERKSEDAAMLEDISARMKAAADQAKFLSDNPDEHIKYIEKELRQSYIFVENSVGSLKEAMDIESRFIHSTILLLEDVILSLVQSFVQLSATLDNTLGESSVFGEELEAIIVNLQFEDVTKEMSQYTLNILSSIISDLHGLNIAGLVEEDFIKIDSEQKSGESEAEDMKAEEVTFF